MVFKIQDVYERKESTKREGMSYRRGREGEDRNGKEQLEDTGKENLGNLLATGRYRTLIFKIFLWTHENYTLDFL